MTPEHSDNFERSPVEGLNSILTPQQVGQFVQKAVPDLKLAKVALLELLENQQWEDAAKHAHKLKSTISLFSVSSLADDLDMIETGNTKVIELLEFREGLGDQCEQLIHSLETHLSKV